MVLINVLNLIFYKKIKGISLSPSGVELGAYKDCHFYPTM